MVVIGLVLYLVEQIPLAAPFQVIVRVIAVLIAIALVLSLAPISATPGWWHRC